MVDYDRETCPITTDDIKRGFLLGIIRLDRDGLGCTVCRIGGLIGNWFYFGGHDAENEPPRAYVRTHDLNDIVADIAAAIDGLGEDEWQLYRSFLDYS